MRDNLAEPPRGTHDGATGTVGLPETMRHL